MEPLNPKWRRGFWSLIATQFQGALNENGLKNLVIYLILSLDINEARRQGLVLVVGALFVVPFFLFSMLGGYFADRFSKRLVTIGTKYFELAVMLFAAAALAWSNMNLAMAAVFLASTQAAIFGPSKYGLLPELSPSDRLSWANGVLELGTFVAIIAGTVTGATMADVFHGRQGISGLIFAAFSLIGLACSYAITRVPPANPSKQFRANFFGELWRETVAIRKDRILSLAVIGNTYFWLLAALLQQTIIFYGHDILHVSDTRGGILQAAVAIGIGVGSMAAGILSHGTIEVGLIPLGSLGMTVFGIALSLPNLSFDTVLGLLVALGFAAGFFAVPVNALIQRRPDEDKKGSVIAAANLWSFVGVGGAFGVYYVLSRFLHATPAAVFLWASLATLVGTIYVLYLLPEALLRLVLFLATHTIYKIDVAGLENIPEKGGALLVANHTTLVDAMFFYATTGRPVRFLMFKDFYEHPLLKPFVKILGIIPISSDQRPREMIHSLRAATEAIRNGDLLCIFPEGQMTRIGQMLPFRRGMERIMKGVDAPIIPVHLDGVWGSMFSFSGGRFLWKFPRRFRYPIRVTFGPALPGDATSQQAREAVQALAADAFARRKRHMSTVPRSLIRTAHRHPFQFAMSDTRTQRLNYGAALAKTLFLARRLRKPWGDQKMVGILLPPSIPGALVNFAAMLAGKIPVNLNYTASSEVLKKCAEQCDLQTVVTSRTFLEKVHLEVPAQSIILEDLAKDPGFFERLAAFFVSLLPSRMIFRFAGCEKIPQLDDVATIIFSSGSTGEPKGVVLTHYNLAANVEQMRQVFHLNLRDRILGILPFFHSFGFSATLCLPAVSGIGAVFHPNPLEARVIGETIRKQRVTMLVATPTFLGAYARRCVPEDFGSLRYVIAGAEKLPERISRAFEDHFGIRPLEGYGCTECSPVVAVNTPDFRAPLFFQVGAKRGTIGHPLPGVTVKILDPDTLESLPSGQAGLMFVRGPNVMAGYWKQPEKTAAVLQDGWYCTGDIATVDEDGFIRITDRLSRFSKIGGEMVPHLRVEEILQELSGVTEQVVAVTAIPDEKKGERLIVLHTLSNDQLETCVDGLAKSDLPSLWKPHRDQFVKIETLPYLGSGKLDLKRLRDLAQQSAEAPTK